MRTTCRRGTRTVYRCVWLLFCSLGLSACGAAEGTEPGHCSDGADNDGDGDFDCADDGCAGAPRCVQSGEAAGEAAAPEEAVVQAEVAIADDGPSADPSTEPPSSAAAVSGALLAYRRLLTAYRDGDADGYFGGYAETLRCFHGRSPYRRSGIERARRAALAGNAAGAPDHPAHARSLEMRVMTASEDEVQLVDYGWTGTGAGDSTVVFHQKWIVLQRQDGRWRVVVETPANRATCGLPALRDVPPPLWTHMRDWFRGLVAECEGPAGSTMEDGYPGLGGSIGCDPTSSVPEPREICAAVDASERAACIGHARAELALFVYGRADAEL